MGPCQGNYTLCVIHYSNSLFVRSLLIIAGMASVQFALLTALLRKLQIEQNESSKPADIFMIALK
jgi:hypothetical protein